MTVAKHRERLTQPLRTDGTIQEAIEGIERGDALDLIHEPRPAMASYMRSLDLYRHLRSDSGECRALLRIGNLRGQMGEYKVAFAFLDSARVMARKAGRGDLEGMALVAMGDICKRIEECGQSAALFRHSIDLALSTRDRRTEAKGYLGITQDLIERGSLKEALPNGQKGLAIAIELKDAVLQERGAILLRDVYIGLGKTVEARNMAQYASDLTAYLAAQRLAMDSIIADLQAEFLSARVKDSLAHQKDRTDLESDLVDQRMRVAKGKRETEMLGALALVTLTGGALYYRYDRRRRKARADKRALNLEVKALRAQMNPHFLFNALNSIHDHILTHEPEEAAYYLSRFSKLMRQVLEFSRENEVTVSRELAVLALYAELEQLRLKQRFTYSVTIDPGIDPDAIFMPPMLLQPFVENAIWHGLSPKHGPGLLSIHVLKQAETLRIIVQDDGIGRQLDSTKGEGHVSLGTTITSERLSLWSEQHNAIAEFTYVPMAVGTKVEITLPWVEA